MSRAKTKERFSSRPPEDKNGTQGRAPSRADAEALLGAVIDGRYEILEVIGQGGMGSVYKAEHTGIHRIVALKLLHPRLASVTEISERFKREAEAIGRIEHPNCVNVSDFGELDDGSLYLVMEYLEGKSLGDVLAEVYRIEPRRTLRILRHVLAGLGHAHKHEIVHRDVKPENVLLVPQENDPDFAKILDFGIAKLIGSAAKEVAGTRLTQAGMAFGTPVYMSPEQAVGNPIDGRADLYAATVMAYEMMTGLPPFNSHDKIEIMTMHTAKPVPTMHEIAPEVEIPPEIEALLMRGLAKRPAERYASADDYISAIDEVLAVLDAADQERQRPMVLSPSGAITPLPGEHTSVDGTAAPEGGVATGTTLQHVAARRSTPVPHGGATATRPARRRLLIAGAVAVMIAVLVGTGAAVLLRGSDGDDDKGTTLAGKAALRLDQGDPQGAIAMLQEDAAVLAQDPAAQLALGHAYAARRDNRNAVAAYRGALEVDAAFGSDEKLRANLEVMLDDKSGSAAADAFVLWAELYKDDAASARLVELASTHPNNDVRGKVVAEVRSRGLDDRVDWVASFILDLELGENCEDRKPAVARLRATGDKRAIPALEKAAARRSKRKGGKRRLINRCLRDDALEAVQYLTNLGVATTDGGPG